MRSAPTLCYCTTTGWGERSRRPAARRSPSSTDARSNSSDRRRSARRQAGRRCTTRAVSSGGHKDTRPDPGNIKDPATFSILTVRGDDGQTTYAVVTVRPDASVTVTPEISLGVPYAEFLDTGVTGRRPASPRRCAGSALTRRTEPNRVPRPPQVKADRDIVMGAASSAGLRAGLLRDTRCSRASPSPCRNSEAPGPMSLRVILPADPCSQCRRRRTRIDPATSTRSDPDRRRHSSSSVTRRWWLARHDRPGHVAAT